MLMLAHSHWCRPGPSVITARAKDDRSYIYTSQKETVVEVGVVIYFPEGCDTNTTRADVEKSGCFVAF